MRVDAANEDDDDDDGGSGLVEFFFDVSYQIFFYINFHCLSIFQRIFRTMPSDVIQGHYSSH